MHYFATPLQFVQPIHGGSLPVLNSQCHNYACHSSWAQALAAQPAMVSPVCIMDDAEKLRTLLAEKPLSSVVRLVTPWSEKPKHVQNMCKTCKQTSRSLPSLGPTMGADCLPVRKDGREVQYL